MQGVGRGIRKLVSLFAPVSAIVYEFDRRNKIMEDGLEEQAINPMDKKAVEAKKEYVLISFDLIDPHVWTGEIGISNHSMSS